MSKRDNQDRDIRHVASEMDLPIENLVGFSQAVSLISKGCRDGTGEPGPALYEIGMVLEQESKRLRQLHDGLLSAIRGQKQISVVA